MDREQLFRNLTELENQLKGIKSATEQVNYVVKADRELAATINEYAHTVNEQVQLLKQIFEGSISQITNQAKGAIKQSSDAAKSSGENLQTELSTALVKIKADYQAVLNKTHKDFKTKVDQTVMKISASCTDLDDISQNRLPLLAERLNDLVENSLRPLVQSEMKKELISVLSLYKKTFDSHAKDVKSLGQEVISGAKEVVDNITSVCNSIPDIGEVAKSESDRVIESFSGKLAGLPEYINKTSNTTKQALGAKIEGNSRSLKNLSASVKELKEELKNQETKFEELKKANKALICMVIVSMLMTLIVHFI